MNYYRNLFAVWVAACVFSLVLIGCSKSTSETPDTSTSPPATELATVGSSTTPDSSSSDAPIAELSVDGLQLKGFREWCAVDDEPMDKRPARRVTKIGYPKRKIARDDAQPELESDKTYVNAAHRYARKVDDYFLTLSNEGFGRWNGCYGSQGNEGMQTPEMESIVEPDNSQGWKELFRERDLHTSWQGDWVIYAQDEALTPQAAYHEWTHGLVDNLLGLPTVGPADCGEGCLPGQTGAIAESISDVFAALISGRYEMSLTHVRRNMAQPHVDEFKDPYYFDSYVTSDQEEQCDHPGFYCKYNNAGILNKAAHLMIEGSGAIEGDRERFGDIRGLGKEMVARIYFHALQPDYIPQENPTFEDFAKGIISACEDLTQSNAKYRAKTSLDITSSDCDVVASAFRAVKILPLFDDVLAPTKTIPVTNVTNSFGAEFEDFHSAWSPDGAAILYGRLNCDKQSGGDGCRASFHVIDVDGKNRIDVSDNFASYLGWSPSVLGWSPTGNHIALWGRPNGGVIYIMEHDGTIIKTFENLPSVQGLTWDPTGKYLTFQSPSEGEELGIRDLFILDINKQYPTLIVESQQIRLFVWSPDGKYIAYTTSPSSEEYQLYVINIDTTVTKKMLDHLVVSANSMDWSSDSRQLVFTGSEAKDNFRGDIYLIDVESGNLRNLTDDNESKDSQPFWVLNDQKIVFTSDTDGNSDIYIMDPDGENIAALTESSKGDLFWTHVSPDGNSIACLISYSVNDLPLYDLFVVKLDEREQFDISTGLLAFNGMDWSPDGKRLALAVTGPAAYSDIINDCVVNGCISDLGASPITEEILLKCITSECIYSDDWFDPSSLFSDLFIAEIGEESLGDGIKVNEFQQSQEVSGNQAIADETFAEAVTNMINEDPFLYIINYELPYQYGETSKHQISYLLRNDIFGIGYQTEEDKQKALSWFASHDGYQPAEDKILWIYVD